MTKVKEERLSDQIHDVNYTITWEERECTVHFSELWKLFEIVSGSTIRESLNKVTLESVGVFSIIYDAKQNYMNANPKAVCPVAAIPKPHEKYLYLYPSIDDESRIAALTKDKAAIFIKEYIVELFKAMEYWRIPKWIETWLDLSKNIGFTVFLQQRGFCFNVIPERFLQKNGVFLKPGKVLDLLMAPGYNKEVFASYFQEELLKNIPNIESVQISDTPSEVYVKGGSFESCMKDKPAHYFKIYDDVKRCQIAYIVDEYDNLLARALLWHGVYDNVAGRTIPRLMDRIYYHSQRELASMKMWAKKNGYLYKVQQKLNEDRWYTPTMELVKLEELCIGTGFELTDDHYLAVPYVDTFSIAVRGDAELYNYTPESDEPSVEMTSTKGYADWLAEGDVYRCTECGTIIENEEDCSWYEDDPYCEHCFDNEFIICNKCKEPCPRDEVNIGTFDGEERCYCEDCTQRMGFKYESWTDEWHSNLAPALILNRKTGEIKPVDISQDRINSDNVHDWRQCTECSTWYDEGVTGENYRCRNCQEDDK